MDRARRGSFRVPTLPPSRQIIYEDFQPSSRWTEDPNTHVLLLDLPGFKKEEVKVQVDSAGKLIVSGERRVSENRYSRFKQVLSAPADSDLSKISGKYENGVLFVVIPKTKTQQQPQEVIPSASTKADEKTTIEEPKKEAKVAEEIPPPKQEAEKKDAAKTAVGTAKRDERPSKEEAKKKDDQKPPREEPKKKDDVAKIGNGSAKTDEKLSDKAEAQVRADTTKKDDKPIYQLEPKMPAPTKKEERPIYKEEPKMKDTVVGDESAKIDAKPSYIEAAKKKLDSVQGDDAAKKDEKPSLFKEEAKKKDSVIGVDVSKKDEKPGLFKEATKKKETVEKATQKEEEKRVESEPKSERGGGLLGFFGNLKRDTFERFGGRGRKCGEKNEREEEEEDESDQEKSSGVVERVVDHINKNRTLIAAAVVAFTVGAVISRRIR